MSVFVNVSCPASCGAEAAVDLLGVTGGISVVSDPEHGGGLLRVAPGVLLRLTRNIDKKNGFVNGQMGVVCEILHGPLSFVLLPLACFTGVCVCFLCADVFALSMLYLQETTESSL